MGKTAVYNLVCKVYDHIYTNQISFGVVKKSYHKIQKRYHLSAYIVWTNGCIYWMDVENHRLAKHVNTTYIYTSTFQGVQIKTWRHGELTPFMNHLTSLGRSSYVHKYYNLWRHHLLLYISTLYTAKKDTTTSRPTKDEQGPAVFGALMLQPPSWMASRMDKHCLKPTQIR